MGLMVVTNWRFNNRSTSRSAKASLAGLPNSTRM